MIINVHPKREARLILNVKRELDVNPVFTGLMFHWPPNGGEADDDDCSDHQQYVRGMNANGVSIDDEVALVRPHLDEAKRLLSPTKAEAQYRTNGSS